MGAMWLDSLSEVLSAWRRIKDSSPRRCCIMAYSLIPLKQFGVND